MAMNDHDLMERVARIERRLAIAPGPITLQERIQVLIEAGWCLDCGKTAIRIAVNARVDEDGAYIAGFYKYKQGRGVYAQGPTINGAIERAIALVWAKDAQDAAGIPVE